MKLPLPEISAAGSPVVATVSALGGAPWYVYCAVGVAGPTVYLVNRCLICLLAWKALDKVGANQVTELMRAITGIPGLYLNAPNASSSGQTSKDPPSVAPGNGLD